jgi:hypothetical protein
MNFVAFSISLTSHQAVLQFDGLFAGILKWRILFTWLRQVRKCLEWRSEWSVVRERNIWVPVLTDEPSTFNFLGDLLVLTSLHLFVFPCTIRFIAVYFQFQWVVHFNIYSCDKQRYTQLKLIWLQPIEWRILQFFGILRFPKWTELLQSAIHFSSSFDEEAFDISFFRQFHFRGMRTKTLNSCAVFKSLHWLVYNWVLSVSLSCPF